MGASSQDDRKIKHDLSVRTNTNAVFINVWVT